MDYFTVMEVFYWKLSRNVFIQYQFERFGLPLVNLYHPSQSKAVFNATHSSRFHLEQNVSIRRTKSLKMEALQCGVRTLYLRLVARLH